jgi:signal transduction histidine kinase/sugar lactone lactonase YvrE
MAENTFSRIDIPNPQNLLYGTSVGQVIEQMIDGDKIIWVNSYAGLLKMNLTSGETKRFLHDENNQQSLIDNQINQITRDLSGVIWLATDNGISYLSPKNARFNSGGSVLLESESSHVLLRKNFTAIAEAADGRIWFGTTDGLYYFSNVNNKVFSYPGFENTPVWSLVLGSDNDLWVGTFGTGLKQIFLKTGLVKSWDLDHPDIRTQAVYYNKTLLRDTKNNVWVGYWGAGVSRINSRTNEYDLWLNDPDNPNSLSNNDVWVIKEDRLGRIWLGTRGGGLNLFEDDGKVIFHRWMKQATNTNGLNSNNIYSMCEAVHLSLEKNETVLWIGTSNGLNKVTIKYKNNDFYDVDVDFVSYTIKDGLPDNSVKSILEDDNGNLWLGTGFGISFFDIQKKLFTNFSTSDGLTSSVFNFESVLKTNSGLMLFGSTNGLNIFRPGKMVLSTFNPPLVITDFLIFNTPVKAGDGSLLKQSASLTEEIILNYSHNVFSFEFAALDFNSPKTIKYAYKMDGFEKDWVYSGSRRLATYTNLDPGEYVFKVKSTNADGVWNENVKAISIIVNPPFWMTWWFRGLIIFVFLSVGPIIYFRRVNHLKKERHRQVEFSKQLIKSQEEERKRIASELHDSLGQDLIVIKNLALMNKNKDEQFDEISKTAGVAIDEVRRISYNLHPYQLDRLGLSKAINSMFTNIEGLSKIKFDVHVGNIDNLFEKEKEINIYRIVQECVTNIIKHSNAVNARVFVEKKGTNLLIEIADDGKSFNFESTKLESTGFGLKNLENRVSFLSGNLEFKSDKKFKTQIKVKIPLG